MSTLKCGFDSLTEDVAVLESASSELLHLSSEMGPCLEEHSKEIEQQLPKIKMSVEDKKISSQQIRGVHSSLWRIWLEISRLS